jgi:hypothetical protein
MTPDELTGVTTSSTQLLVLAGHSARVLVEQEHGLVSRTIRRSASLLVSFSHVRPAY